MTESVADKIDEPGDLACVHGCDHPQPVKNDNGDWLCMDCWVHREEKSVLIPWSEVYDL